MKQLQILFMIKLVIVVVVAAYMRYFTFQEFLLQYQPSYTHYIGIVNTDINRIASINLQLHHGVTGTSYGS